MRKIALLFGLPLALCALWSSHQHKAFPLLVDAAASDHVRPSEMRVTPCEVGPRTFPIVNPEHAA